MLTQLQFLALLSQVDVQLEELREELGDLPLEVEEMERTVREKQRGLDATQKELDDLLKFRTDGRITLQNMKERQQKITDQQFQVRNNREFDAITKEIETIQTEQKQLDKDLVGTNLKEENLRKIIAEKAEDLAEAKERLAEKEQELRMLSSDQNEEVTDLLKRRSHLAGQIQATNLTTYEHIREYHKQSVAKVRKGSCSGCFSSVPPQKLVEMRNYKRLEFCENCGRILYPEEMEIPETL